MRSSTWAALLSVISITKEAVRPRYKGTSDWSRWSRQHNPVTVSGGGFVDHANPKLVRDMEALPVTMNVGGEIDESLRGQKQAIDFPQVLDTLLGGVNHAVGVNGQRLYPDFERESKQRNLFVGMDAPPDGLVTFHQAEERSHDPRNILVRSAPGSLASCSLAPRKLWQTRKPSAMAMVVIQMSMPKRATSVSQSSRSR